MTATYHGISFCKLEHKVCPHLLLPGAQGCLGHGHSYQQTFTWTLSLMPASVAFSVLAPLQPMKITVLYLDIYLWIVPLAR